MPHNIFNLDAEKRNFTPTFADVEARVAGVEVEGGFVDWWIVVTVAVVKAISHQGDYVTIRNHYLTLPPSSR